MSVGKEISPNRSAGGCEIELVRIHIYQEHLPNEINTLILFLFHISGNGRIVFITFIPHCNILRSHRLIFLPLMNNNVRRSGGCGGKTSSLSDSPTVILLIKEWGGFLLKCFADLEQNGSLKVLWLVNSSRFLEWKPGVFVVETMMKI